MKELIIITRNNVTENSSEFSEKIGRFIDTITLLTMKNLQWDGNLRWPLIWKSWKSGKFIFGSGNFIKIQEGQGKFKEFSVSE